jgi:DNA-binding transcriptional regulator YiaG
LSTHSHYVTAGRQSQSVDHTIPNGESGAVNASETLLLVQLRHLMKSGEAKRIREKVGLSVRAAAGAADISAAGLWRWEAGERIPTGNPALRYAGFLGQLAPRIRAHRPGVPTAPATRRAP